MHVKLLLREAMASRLAMLGRVASNNRLGSIVFCDMWIDQAMAVGLALPTLNFFSWTCVCPPSQLKTHVLHTSNVLRLNVHR